MRNGSTRPPVWRAMRRGQVPLRHVLRSADQKRLAHRLGSVERQQEALDQVVDEHGVVEAAARADDCVAAACDRAEQLQQPRLSRAVDGAGPHDGDGHAALAVVAVSERLAFRLRLLVDVARADGRRLVGRRVLDVPVHAYRRRVHEAPDARRGSGLEQALSAPDVDVAVVRVGMTGRPVDRRHVQHRVVAFDQAADRGRVARSPSTTLAAAARAPTGGRRSRTLTSSPRAASACKQSSPGVARRPCQRNLQVARLLVCRRERCASPVVSVMAGWLSP